MSFPLRVQTLQRPLFASFCIVSLEEGDGLEYFAAMEVR